MKIFLLVICFSLASCSLLYKRKSHFDYLDRGVSKNYVLQKSGTPSKKKILRGNYDYYIYNFCNASYLEEAFFGILSFGLYTLNCNKRWGQLGVLFKDGKLVRMDNGYYAHDSQGGIEQENTVTCINGKDGSRTCTQKNKIKNDLYK